MKIGYYPGCSLHGTAREFDESWRAVAPRIGLELQEVDDWSCCGASSAHVTGHRLAVALAARNLALAEQQGLTTVLAPCAACYNRLDGARRSCREDEAIRAELPQILGRPFADKVGVRNAIEVLTDAIPALKASPTKPLAGVKVACYYGCLLVRPAETTHFDDAEMPDSMEKIAAASGAVPVRWNKAIDCCGGAFSVSRPGSVLRLARDILDDAAHAGAEVVLAACPMCHSNLDFRQAAMARRGGDPMPVLYLSQLAGLTLGLDGAVLGLDRHFVSPRPLLARAAARADAAKPAQAAAGGA